MKSTQSSNILEYLQTGKTLTPLEALDKFGCLRLGARIHDLKKIGCDITRDLVQTPSGKRVAQYGITAPPLPAAPF